MQNVIAVKLKPKAEVKVKKGHPWVFSESIIKENKPPKTGDIAIVFDQKKNQFLAIGLYDCESPIRIKIIQAHQPAKITSSFINELITTAYKKREPLLKKNITGYRLINGENDQLPTVIVDVYNNVAVLKLYSFIFQHQLKDIIDSLVQLLQPTAIIFRCSRSIEANASTILGYANGDVIYGELEYPEVTFQEYNVQFKANVIDGHKTGYFLDHRENRHKVGQLANDKTVLDVFSYAGGFSVHALAGGAIQVTSVDISKQALEVAQENARLNKGGDRHKVICGDAFEVLNQLYKDSQRFDIVVVDPPSFAKQQSEIDRALHSYSRLARLASRLVQKGGLLVMASCSSRVTSDVFFSTIEQAIQQEQLSFKRIKITTHPIDHPVIFDEANYLKCGYYQMT